MGINNRLNNYIGSTLHEDSNDVNRIHNVDNINIKEYKINRTNDEFKQFLRDFKKKYYDNCIMFNTSIEEINMFRFIYFPILEMNSEDYIENMIRVESYTSTDYNSESGEQDQYLSHVIKYINYDNIIQKKVLSFKVSNQIGYE